MGCLKSKPADKAEQTPLKGKSTDKKDASKDTPTNSVSWFNGDGMTFEYQLQDGQLTVTVDGVSKGVVSHQDIDWDQVPAAKLDAFNQLFAKAAGRSIVLGRLTVMGKAAGAAVTRPRPPDAVGDFLRVLTINDCYKLGKYPNVASAVASERAMASKHGCVVKAFMNGDFLCPCMLTALDGGHSMMDALNLLGLDYACFGNHEFDVEWGDLVRGLSSFPGKLVNSNVENEEFASFPRYDSFTVGERTVVIGGYTTEDMSDYKPSARPTVVPIPEACFRTWSDVKDALGKTPDLFLPMTHQRMPPERELCQRVAEDAELGARTPVILGGHDHDVYEEEVGKSIVVKVGEDAEKISFIDIWWTEDGTLKCKVELIPTEQFSPDPKVTTFVQQKADLVEKMMSVPITEIPRKMSSKNVRHEASAESSVATFLCSVLKRGLKEEGVELVMVQGGAIRGKSDYEPGPFLMGDLYKEFAFESFMSIVQLPGNIIEDSIKASRATIPNAFLLHVDDGVAITTEGAITSIDSQAFDAGKLYTVSIYRFLLESKVEPLMTYVKEHIQVPGEEASTPAKEIFVGVCMKDIWKEILNLGEDSSADEMGQKQSKLDEAFKTLPSNERGDVDLTQLKQKLSEDTKKRAYKTQMATHLIKSLDKDGKGYINRKDLELLVR